MSAFDGDYKESAVSVDDVVDVDDPWDKEPSLEDLLAIEKEHVDLFDEDEYEVFPNGVDAFNENPHPVYSD